MEIHDILVRLIEFCAHVQFVAAVVYPTFLGFIHLEFNRGRFLGPSV